MDTNMRGSELDTPDVGTASVPTPRAVAALLRDVLVANYASLHERLRHRLGDADLASDCLHDAWLRLGDVPMPVSVHDPLAYVYRVVYHRAMDWLRAQPAMQHLDDEQWARFSDSSPSLEQAIEARSSLAAVDRVLRHLPAVHREVLVALRLENKTREEVARFYGLTHHKVDTLLRQALRYCAVACGETWWVAAEARPEPRRLPRRWHEALTVSAIAA